MVRLRFEVRAMMRTPGNSKRRAEFGDFHEVIGSDRKLEHNGGTLV